MLMKRIAVVAIVIIMGGVCIRAEAYQEAQVTNGATVKGTVRFEGAMPPSKAFELWRAPNRDFCGALSGGSEFRVLREVVVSEDNRLKDVVVTIEDVSQGKPFELKETKLDANICQFLPFVSVVREQHPMTIFNLDPVSHDLQVYERDREHVIIMFHRPAITKTGTTGRIVFTGDRREMTMQCGMHPYMQAHGLAVENPYYAVTGPDGTYEISNLPPGTYRIRAWHPVLPPHEQRITVSPDSPKDIDFTFKSPSQPLPTVP
jgi:Carboxypeptidase regulatory-like domain